VSERAAGRLARTSPTPGHKKVGKSLGGKGKGDRDTSMERKEKNHVWSQLPQRNRLIKSAERETWPDLPESCSYRAKKGGKKTRNQGRGFRQETCKMRLKKTYDPGKRQRGSTINSKETVTTQERGKGVDTKVRGTKSRNEGEDKTKVLRFAHPQQGKTRKNQPL